MTKDFSLNGESDKQRVLPETEQRALERQRRRLESFITHRSGIAFDTLVRFAEPIFELYDMEPQDCLSFEGCSSEQMAIAISVLETARLMWSFFDMEEAEQQRYFSSFAEQLLGPEADASDQEQFKIFLEDMASYRAGLIAEEPELENMEAAFTMLVQQSEVHAGSDGIAYGPEHLELTDAMAVFSKPLLEKPETLRDPEALDSAMVRASEYWELAQLDQHAYLQKLNGIKHRHAHSPGEARQIEEEARRMVARFYQLFPEKATGR